MVLVHTEEDDIKTSMLVTVLGAGESTTISANLISVMSIDSNDPWIVHAIVEITPSLTPPPTPVPTPFPTQNPTTGTPTSPPTPPPTPNPTSTTTPPPIPSPTASNPPTPRPSTSAPLPTSKPTKNEDDADDDEDDVCENKSGWKFVKKNGKKKGCKWFANRKQRCNKKVGELQNCPVTCSVCVKSGVRVCENRNLKRKVCKSVDCCTWDNASKSCKSDVGTAMCL